MKIHCDGVNFASSTGPNTFANRLARGLFESGHTIVDRGPDADVSLVFIEATGQPLAKKVVQRLDGIWFKPEDYNTKNAGIVSLYHTADAVVFQSGFDSRMAVKWFGEPARGAKHSRVIKNGINIAPVTELTIPSLITMRNTYKKMYVCSANWHLQKRLSENVRLFKQLRATEPNSCLIVLGNNPDVMVADPHIFYAGSQPPEVYNQVYSACDWMLHLAWADHCPNVVIEALAQGTPVVCSSTGGTRELVADYGITLDDVGEPYDFQLYDYDRPPLVDMTGLTSLPDRSSFDEKTWEDTKFRIGMDRTLRQYINVFNDVLYH